MNNKQIWGAVAVVIVILLAGWGYYNKSTATQTTTTEPLKIGAIYALTGPAAKYGEISLHGAKDAAKYIEETTSQKVTILSEDSAGDPKQGVSAANKLFNLDGVKFAVIGTSAISAAVAPVAESAKAILISDAALLGLTKDKQFTFQNFMPALSGISNQINLDPNGQKIAVVYINDEFGNVWNKTIINSLNTKTKNSFSFDKTTTDFKTQALKIKAFNPDAMVVIGYGPALNQVFADLTLNKVNGHIFTYLACTLPGVIGDKRFDLNGMTSYEYPTINNPQIAQWIKDNNGETNPFYLAAFENTLLAVKAAQSSNNDSEKAAAYLKSNTVSNLVWGDVKFDQSGVVNRELIPTTITNNVCIPQN